jgi:hypothetical protein
VAKKPNAKPTFLLLVSSVEADRALCAQVAEAAGMEFRAKDKLADAVGLLGDPGLGCLFLDSPNEADFLAFEKAYRKAQASGVRVLDGNLIHFLASGPLNGVAYIVRSELFSNCIVRTSFDPKEAGAVYGRLIGACARGETGILGRILDANAETRRVSPVISTEKEKCINEVSQFLVDRGFPTRIASRIATATDELLMNAIFDAPVDDEGKVIFNNTARSAEIKLEGKHTVELMMGFDGKYAAISVVDHFGSLEKKHLTDKISRSYQDSSYKVSDASVGAGLGVFTVFHSGVSLIYATHPRVRTESVIAFRKTDNVREFKEQFHFLSLMSKIVR